jgi:hypothetical protein
MIHARVGQPIGQFTGDVVAAIVAEQPRPAWIVTIFFHDCHHASCAAAMVT